MSLNHGSLFSGIGGFDLAAERMGWENLFHCEWNPFGRKTLKYYWPNAISYEDITKTDFTIHRGNIDILTGGFPCQPYSTAGKRKGKEDDRHLWPEMLRAIQEIQPKWVVGENVLGLVNWNGGMVFEEVCTDLEGQGYKVQPYVLPAAGVNAPHQRYRVWFIAYSDMYGHELRGFGEDRQKKGTSKSKKYKREWVRNDARRNSQQGTTSDADHTRTDDTLRNNENGAEENQRRKEQPQPEFREGSRDTSDADSRRQSSKEHGKKESGRPTKEGFFNKWENFPTQSPICNGDDGFSSRLDSITFPKWRNESIKAGGNAIVPQVAFEFFKVIDKMEKGFI